MTVSIGKLDWITSRKSASVNVNSPRRRWLKADFVVDRIPGSIGTGQPSRKALSPGRKVGEVTKP